MLKISDGNTQQSTQQNTQSRITKPPLRNTAMQVENKTLDTPLLVDHARQTERIEDGKSLIWYCLRLMEFSQSRKQSLPRYDYLRDEDTNLIRARICIPDYKRSFIGDPCTDPSEAIGKVAKKAYEKMGVGEVMGNYEYLSIPYPLGPAKRGR